MFEADDVKMYFRPESKQVSRGHAKRVSLENHDFFFGRRALCEGKSKSLGI